MADVLTKIRALPLTWSEALRALVCLIPLLVATALDQTTYLVTLGQGAFFFSTLFLPPRLSGRIVMGSLVVALGLGFYLIGGTVAPTPVIAPSRIMRSRMKGFGLFWKIPKSGTKPK